MKYKKILPSKRIDTIVDFFWDFQGDFSEHAYNHSTAASINPKLAFQYKAGMRIEKGNTSESLFTSGFQCQTKSPYSFSASEKIGVFGISFKPYAIPLLFNIPARTTTGLNIEISDILGKEGEVLEDKILNSTHTDGRVAIASSYIESKLKSVECQSSNVLAAINYLLTTNRCNIQQLAEAHFLSQRQFERRFNELTGFSPKTFTRIIRFENCIAKAYDTPQSLTQLSLVSGYYDQSHMIRDFREFTGKIPKDFFTENHSLFLS